MPVRDLLSAASGASSVGPADPYFYDVSLLLNGDGTNGSQNNTFLDSSTNNFTITRNGNTTQGSFSPYGNLWSNSFNGSSNSGIRTASTIAIGTNSFTIEGWVYLNDSSDQWLFGCMNYAGGGGNSDFGLDVLVSGGTLYANMYSGSSASGTTSTTLPTNTWVHLAYVRNGSACTLYKNGTSVSTASSSASVNTWGFVAGYDGSGGGRPLNGYLSNVRLVNGSAVYTSNFTPSITPLTAITNTAVLTCQSNRFIDNSSNNYALTANSSTSVQRFSPFNPTSTYSTSVIGGSGYFDGSGDIYTANSLTPLQMGTGDYTYELWAYHTSISGQQTYFSRSSSGNAAGVYFYKDTSNYIGLYYSSQIATSSVTISANQWYHLAVTRASGTVRIFVNGTQVATASDSTNLTESQVVVGGNINNSNNIVGYISDSRVIKGTALYTSSFTPPTAPLTNITNTSLLNNMTNAGIPDLAMQNDLQTVGTAQVSTSVKKYGTGSLSFNGTTDYLISPAKPVTTMVGDFSVECWAYHSSASGNSCLWCIGDDGTASGISLILANSGTAIYLYANNGYLLNLTGQPSTLNSWIYWSVIRSGSTITLYRNGTSIGTATYSTTFNGGLYVGVEWSTSTFYNYCNGYIDDLRITNGYARPSTVPTAALPTY